MPATKTTDTIGESAVNLALSYQSHYGRSYGVIYLLRERAEMVEAELTRQDAVRMQEPVHGTSAHKHYTELKALIEMRSKLTGRLGQMFRYFNHEEELKRRERELDEAKDMVALYDLILPHFTWKLRSLDPTLAWSYRLHAYVLGFNDRPVYAECYGGRVSDVTALSPDICSRPTHHYHLAVVCKARNIMIGSSEHRNLIEDLHEQVDYMLGALEPQYHNEKEYY